MLSDVLISVFFFQAEDGIRDLTVTGVQTCALPIYRRGVRPQYGRGRRRAAQRQAGLVHGAGEREGVRDVPARGARDRKKHTSELQSQSNLVCRLLLEKKRSNQKLLTWDHADENEFS